MSKQISKIRRCSQLGRRVLRQNCKFLLMAFNIYIQTTTNCVQFEHVNTFNIPRLLTKVCTEIFTKQTRSSNIKTDKCCSCLISLLTASSTTVRESWKISCKDIVKWAIYNNTSEVCQHVDQILVSPVVRPLSSYNQLLFFLLQTAVEYEHTLVRHIVPATQNIGIFPFSQGKIPGLYQVLFSRSVQQFQDLGIQEKWRCFPPLKHTFLKQFFHLTYSDVCRKLLNFYLTIS